MPAECVRAVMHVIVLCLFCVTCAFVLLSWGVLIWVGMLSSMGVDSEVESAAIDEWFIWTVRLAGM